MVIHRKQNFRRREAGWLTAELVVAMAILTTALLPIGFSFLQEQKLSRAYYLKAIAIEIVDGEMEVLAAGEWQNCLEGTNNYAVLAKSVRNLPRGRFQVMRSATHLRLEWIPAKKSMGGKVWREIKLPSEADLEE